MPKKTNARDDRGRIRVRVYLGKDAEGKPRYKYCYGKTQKEADAKAAEIRAELAKGRIPGKTATFGEWAEVWVNLKESTVGKSTMVMYRSMLKHLSPIYSRPIGMIQPAEIEQVLIDASKEGLSKSTLKKIRITADQVFTYAIKNRACDFNPAQYASPPAAAENKRRALTALEVDMVVNTPHRAQPAAMIMLYTGLRRGEVLALRWEDIDLINRSLIVNKTVIFVDGGRPEIKDTTKTPAGMRTVPIPDILADYLSTLPNRSGLFCPSAQGKLMSETAWRRLWQSYLVEINVHYGAAAGQNKHNPQGVPLSIFFTAHYLRHTYATTLHTAGVDVLTAQYLLGHSDVKTTLSIYTHLEESKKALDIAKLNAYLAAQNSV